MKKFLGLLLLISSLFVLGGHMVNAQVDTLEEACKGGSAQSSTLCSDKRYGSSRDRITGPQGVMMRIARTLSLVVGAVSVIVIIIGGFKYVLSGGDSNGVASAKNTILYAVVGLAVALLAQIIVNVFLGNLRS